MSSVFSTSFYNFTSPIFKSTIIIKKKKKKKKKIKKKKKKKKKNNNTLINQNVYKCRSNINFNFVDIELFIIKKKMNIE